MPLHRFFVPKGLYSTEDKAAIATAVTGVYSQLPAFYVVVLFIELEHENFFVGGKSNHRFLRIGVEHIARNFRDDQHKRAFLSRYERALEPFTKARGIDWEIQVTDCDRLLWHENGMAPPLADTEEENIWKQENRAVPLESEEMEALKARNK
ncbi:putative oxalocrotonate tautomerase [Mycena pura]|uniref:Oxalocrotonate tautomerase n=1 Tax=Mycena pura TaxID=153505 RepID=A0AAD6YCD5_9AGAR|nr:putative oxalocrotonate tautomerase [Mycena pura]